mmetsp:Transcript_9928/g.12899  ORF Transcript_9928/g.12899 Transcript_9928/m.12899 type:complete len:217 (+) Transcript_9928:169-819(+)
MLLHLVPLAREFDFQQSVYLLPLFHSPLSFHTFPAFLRELHPHHRTRPIDPLFLKYFVNRLSEKNLKKWANVDKFVQHPLPPRLDLVDYSKVVHMNNRTTQSRKTFHSQPQQQSKLTIRHFFGGAGPTLPYISLERDQHGEAHTCPNHIPACQQTPAHMQNPTHYPSAFLGQVPHCINLRFPAYPPHQPRMQYVASCAHCSTREDCIRELQLYSRR